MTETRKEILEMLKPYTDKTTSFWCIVKIPNNFVQVDNALNHFAMAYDDKWNFLASQSIFLNKGKRFLFNEIEILWHYDITAVFNFFDWIKSKKEVWPVYFDNVIWQQDCWVFQKTDYTGYIKIPKKPLHLYTEEEDKNLLEILLKLNKDG